MPNRNYLRGRGKEYRTRTKLEKAGYIVLRSAQSQGFADLTAIKTVPAPEIRFIQCKPKHFSVNERLKLMKENVQYNGLFNVTFEVM